MEWFPKVLTLISESKRLYASIFISSLIYLFLPGFLFEIEGFYDFYSKTRSYSIASLVFSSGFLIYDLLRFSFGRISSILGKFIKNRNYKKMMNSLDRDQVLFVREFFIRGSCLISLILGQDDFPIFIHDLVDKRVLVIQSICPLDSLDCLGRFDDEDRDGDRKVFYMLDDQARIFISENISYFFDGLSPESDEIAKQRPQYLVEGQRLGQIR